MNFYLGRKCLELFKFLLQNVGLLDFVYESPVALFAHALSIMRTIGVLTPCDFVTPPNSLLEAAGLAHLIQVCLTNNMRAFVDDRFCFPFLASTFLSSLFKLSLVTVFAKAFCMIPSIFMTTCQNLIWNLHHVLSLLTRFY